MRHLSILLIVLLAIPHTLSAQAVMSLQRDYVRIVDSNGKLVGQSPAIGSSMNAANVVIGFAAPGARSLDSIIVPLTWIGASEGHPRYVWADAILYFELADCAGQAYASAETMGPGGRRLGAVMEGNALFVSDADPAVEQYPNQSHRIRDQPCQGGGANWLVAVKASGIDLDDVWEAPFLVR